MIRLIAFVLAVVSCVGLIFGAHNAFTAMSDRLTFTEKVMFGDPSVLNGRVLTGAIRCGDHMQWSTTYRFGEEDVYDTEFLFSQKRMEEEYVYQREYMDVYTVSGFGTSTTGTLAIRNTGYGDMVRAVAAITGDGQRQEMNLKLADYVDYHIVSFDLDYLSEKYYCSESVDFTDHFIARWEDEAGSFEAWVKQYGSDCYLDFCELFKFPVRDDEIVTISVEKDALGNVIDLSYHVENGSEVSIITAVNDNGAYCIPVYWESVDATEALPGEYRYGMGIYFIPWREILNTTERVSTGGYTDKILQEVTLDVDNAENIYPLSEGAVVYGLEVDEESQIAWMLSLEEGMYVLTQLDLNGNQVLQRLELLEPDSESGDYYPTWYCQGELMVVEVCERMALVDLGEEPTVEFAVPLGEAMDGFRDFSNETGTIWYDGETLILADSRYYYDALSVSAYDETGPLYWGVYDCSIFEANDPGSSPFIQNANRRVTIE